MSSQNWILVIGAYLLGSVPTAFIVVKLAAGQDIRLLGDGNVGARNTYESVSRRMGFLVAGLDIGKGWLVIKMARQLGFSDVLVLLAGAALVLGHDFSIFLRFQGGQGMAATVGVFFGLFPLYTLVAFLAFLVSLGFTKSWDLSCALGFGLLVISVWSADQPLLELGFVLLILPWIGFRKMLQNRSSREAVV